MYNIILYMLGIAIFICFVRIVRGPSIPDRVIAADTISLLAVALIILFAFQYNNTMFIDIAIVIAILGFVSTLVISKYLLGKGE